MSTDETLTPATTLEPASAEPVAAAEPVAPAVPVEAAPVVPVEAAPVVPVEAAPVVPVEAAPLPAPVVEAPVAAPPDWAAFQVKWVKRVFVVALILSGIALMALRATRLVDLAAGKPWRASSKWTDCDPSIGRCGGSMTLALFHTDEDESPWFELDLQQPTTFTGVTVKNRTDWMPERAIPLILEVSDDRMNWRELARRDEVFLRWTARFPSTTTRFVRVRVPRKTYLHLEGVEVHP